MFVYDHIANAVGRTRFRVSIIALWAVALVFASFVGGVQAAAGQVPTQAEAEQRLGQSVSNAEIIERLRQSGLSRAQIRTRLQQMGYDPRLADEYFDALEGGGEPPRGEAPDELLDALREIGIGTQGIGLDTIPRDTLFPDRLAMDSVRADAIRADSLAPGELPIFGRELFQNSTSQFQPVTTGPVDPGYRLGPGDQLALILTGDVETAYALEVTREGFIVVPDVGQILVNGLTLRELEDRLYARLGDVYSGIDRGPGATAQFQVSLGRLRSNQVFLIGEVERPGAYQVSAVATAFNALYRARGPNRNGSFREIEVRRGGEIVQTIDVYDYLLHGDSRNDIRLQQGDVVFVPVVGKQVAIRGAVSRPAIYEMKPNEGLRDLLRFAGRLEANALLSRVQIDRILPPDSRIPGIERVLVDVDVSRLLSEGGEPIALRDGDAVQVFTVSTERRNRLTVTGEVRRPGLYEWAPGMTIWDLIARADGLDEQAYTPRAHIYRLNEFDGTRRLIQTPLLADSAGRPLEDIVLADRDSIVVYSRAELGNPQLVTIDGFVKNPGTYMLADGMTARDLVLAAGGFVRGADRTEADIARLPDGMIRTDTTSYIIEVPLELSIGGGADGAVTSTAGLPTGDLPTWVPEPQELELLHGDRVFIRKAPGYEQQRPVSIVGQVIKPGTYILATRQERLLDVLERAGGLTDEAYPAGLRVVRDDNLVATDLERALRDPESRYNLVLEPGDSIQVPRLDPTVLVTGAVAFEARVLYEPGRSLDYYISRAGGYTEAADVDRVSIVYPDGERATVDDFLFFRNAPEPQAGSTIFVPARPGNELGGVDWDQFLSRSLSIVTTAVTLLIALRQF